MAKQIYYTLIGSRETPDDICDLMVQFAKKGCSFGYIVRSGGADKADTCAEIGVNLFRSRMKIPTTKGNDFMEIYLPWKDFNGRNSKDVWFRKALQVIRFGIKEHYPKVCEGLNKKWVGDNHSEDAVYIAPTNAMVNNYNDLYLSRNPNRKMTFEVEFDKKYNKNLFPMDWEVTLAVGCKVITLVNLPDAGFQNGTVLTITSISTEGVYGTKLNGDEIFVPIHEFKEDEVYVSEENTKEGIVRTQKRRHIASAYMLPVKLCAAFSCMRVQGRNFDFETVVDFGSDRQSWLYTKVGMEDFMQGGAFVALSRVTNIDHLKLKNNVYPHHFKVCEDSKAFWFESLEEMKRGSYGETSKKS